MKKTDATLCNQSDCNTLFDILKKDISRCHILKGAALMAKFKELSEAVGTPDYLRIRNEIVNGTMRLIFNFLKNKEVSDNQFCDCFQECANGLVKAVESFNPEIGSNFSSWALFYFRKYINNEFQADMSKAQSKSLEIKKRIKRTESHYVSEHGFLPFDDELAQLSGESLKSVQIYRIGESSIFDSSIKVAHNYDDSEDGRVYTPKDDCTDLSDDAFDQMYEGEISTVLNSSISVLPTKQREVVCQYFGLNPENKRYNFEEIGRQRGISGVAVGRLFDRARKTLKTNGLLQAMHDDSYYRDQYFNY